VHGGAAEDRALAAKHCNAVWSRATYKKLRDRTHHGGRRTTRASPRIKITLSRWESIVSYRRRLRHSGRSKCKGVQKEGRKEQKRTKEKATRIKIQAHRPRRLREEQGASNPETKGYKAGFEGGARETRKESATKG